MTRVALTRHVAADPASVALLLAGPMSDAEHGAAADDGGLRLTPVGPDPDVANVTVSPPVRRGVGFTAHVTVFDGHVSRASGQITVEPASDPGCDVRLSLAVGNPADAPALSRLARGYLHALAARARSRSLAA